MFTRVTVSWEVGGSDEVEPTSGSVTFEEGQQFGSFEIRALPDEVCVSSTHYKWLYDDLSFFVVSDKRYKYI